MVKKCAAAVSRRKPAGVTKPNVAAGFQMLSYRCVAAPGGD
ncbi:MAG TPA: hypothetical protein VG733_13700 [Chthoniobacteraceae bacterium]|nr:hypothetical protein [Chthoniobacteraceae bacterium]